MCNLYLDRLPKFKSEVNKVLRLPLPECMVEQLPALRDSTMGGSYVYRRPEKGLSNRTSSETGLQFSLKRANSLPLTHYKARVIGKKFRASKFSSSLTSHPNKKLDGKRY